MSRTWDLCVEWLFPGRVHQNAIPPLEAGMRPNDRLDHAHVLARFEPFDVEDLAALDGQTLVASGPDIVRLGAAATDPALLVTLPARVTALAASAEAVFAAVDGVGIFVVAADGAARLLSDDPKVSACVTAIAAGPGGTVYACVGSTSTTEWPEALVDQSATGLLLEISAGGVVHVLASELAWPSGVAVNEDELLVSVSHAHRIERRARSDGRHLGDLFRNLAGYPGRIARAASADDWWIAVPYMRNRATELMLDEDALRREMRSTIEPTAWLVPQLAAVNEYRAPLQVGQMRVLGQLKPWAPPRSYGLAFRFSAQGRVRESVHSRPGGTQHGVTAVLIDASAHAVFAVRGSGSVVQVTQTQEAS